MQSIRNVERLNALELDKVVPPNASWHTDYRDTAYIYIGGLPFELSEGDILTIFSQYGNPVHVNLARDKETGRSRGFAFLKYEDQRSCDLAVDNLSGASVLGRSVSVDHTRYELKEGEVEGAGMDEEEDGGDETDWGGEGRRKRRGTESESGGGEGRPVLREEVELERLRREMEDGDPMEGYLVREKEEEEVALALKAVGRRREKGKKRHRHQHRSRKDELDEDGEGREKRRRHGSRREESEDGEKDRRPRRSTREGSGEDRRADRRNGHGSSKRERGYEDDRDRPRARRERSPTTSDEEVGGRERGHGRR